jgi:serine phosphatase RsbU (regulator of sigma subunit)
VTADGASFLPLSPAAPFGAPATAAAEWSGTLPPGAALVLFTDGLVEERHQDISEGIDRLLASARDAGTTQPGLLADRLLADLAGRPRGDDVALLVVRRDADS